MCIRDRHKDKGHAADEAAYEGKPREGACDYATNGCHGVAVLVLSLIHI